MIASAYMQIPIFGEPLEGNVISYQQGERVEQYRIFKVAIPPELPSFEPNPSTVIPEQINYRSIKLKLEYLSDFQNYPYYRVLSDYSPYSYMESSELKRKVYDFYRRLEEHSASIKLLELQLVLDHYRKYSNFLLMGLDMTKANIKSSVEVAEAVTDRPSKFNEDALRKLKEIEEAIKYFRNDLDRRP